MCSDRVNLFKERVFISVKQGIWLQSRTICDGSLHPRPKFVNHSTTRYIEKMKINVKCMVCCFLSHGLNTKRRVHTGYAYRTQRCISNLHQKAGASHSQGTTAHTKSFVTWKSEIEAVLIIRSLKILKRWGYHFLKICFCRHMLIEWSTHRGPRDRQEEKKNRK